ncbi:ferredoxin [Jiangella endophytica]|uniref:ferredoxin n=1 Tax=Jiangella endophytica TaxID=1623398 RepID=UPI000E341354|nr:ferredoxin [Jiangella endophytica]
MNRTGLHVDWTRCDGRGLCVELLPDLLGRDEWGYPLPHRSTPGRLLTEVPPGSVADAEQAVALCPLLALTLTTEAAT